MKVKTRNGDFKMTEMEFQIKVSIIHKALIKETGLAVFIKPVTDMETTVIAVSSTNMHLGTTNIALHKTLIPTKRKTSAKLYREQVRVGGEVSGMFAMSGMQVLMHNINKEINK